MADVALAHDYLLCLRGAERTFSVIADSWPHAPITTLLYDEERTERRFAQHAVRTSYLQRLGIRQRGFRRLLPLFPRTAENLAVEDCDVVVSSSSAFAHGFRTPPEATHVCYCHSPFRYAWHERGRALEEVPSRLRWLTREILERVRAWDVQAAQRVTHYVANSQLTRERIRRFWGREATVVHPPVEVDRFRVTAPEDYFLVVSELVPHKRVTTALEAAARAGCRIKVVGTGPQHEHLSSRFRATAEFLGSVDDRDLAYVYSRARALVVANVEEFGIAAVEAQASGRPVIAADGGGARETVVPGVTGVLVPRGDVDALADAMRRTDFDRFDPGEIRRNAERFGVDAFREAFAAEVERLTERRVDRRQAA